MPKLKRKLIVMRSIFNGLIFIEVGGKQINFSSLQEARQYAADHKYHGIKIKYL